MDSQSVDVFIRETVEKPEKFYTRDQQLTDSITQMMRHTFAVTKASCDASGKRVKRSHRSLCPLKELVTDGFDNEQIWEQIRLLSDPLCARLIVDLDQVQKLKDTTSVESDLEMNDIETDTDDQNSDEEDLHVENDSMGNREASSNENEEDNNDEEEDNDETAGVMSTKRRRLLEEDLGLNRSRKNITDQHNGEIEEDDGSEDDFEDDIAEEEDEETINLTYRDFFGDKPPAGFDDDIVDRISENRTTHTDFDDEDEDFADDLDMEEDMDMNTKVSSLFAADEIEEDDDEDNESGNIIRDNGVDETFRKPKTSFEKQAAKIYETIRQLEKENVAEKTWTLKGEVSSKARPLNSLLEEDLEFENVQKPVPVITEEHTNNVEDLIKRRIVDGAFDNVERKVAIDKPIFNPTKYAEISDEKNTQSLAEVYEQEYLKAVGSTKSDSMNEALRKQHDEVEQLRQDLFSNLDALSNFFFTPKQPKLEITVKADVPAIQLEEVIPVHVSESALKAPEEVYGKQRGDVKGETELTKMDKNRLREESKNKKRKRMQEQKKKQALMATMSTQNPDNKTSNKGSMKDALRTLVKSNNTTIIGSNNGGVKPKRAYVSFDISQSSGAKLRL